MCAKNGNTDFAFIEEPNGAFIPFISEVCMIARRTDKEKAEIPTLTEFITVQVSLAHCRAAFTSLGKPNTRFNIDSEGVLVRVSSTNGASQRVMPAPLRFRLLRHFY